MNHEQVMKLSYKQRLEYEYQSAVDSAREYVKMLDDAPYRADRAEIERELVYTNGRAKGLQQAACLLEWNSLES